MDHKFIIYALNLNNSGALRTTVKFDPIFRTPFVQHKRQKITHQSIALCTPSVTPVTFGFCLFFSPPSHTTKKQNPRKKEKQPSSEFSVKRNSIIRD
jgi:hypothetical protein